MVARVVERRIVTVLFVDLVGFTALSERLDAEDVSIVQDAYFEAVRTTIQRHGGQLEKFVGDAAMAVFGAPRVRDDDAERAVRAGLALVSAISHVGSSLGLDEDTLRLRVGVNTGEAVYGEASTDRGPVTGDTVNVAARLQAAADPGSVVVGEVTALAVAEAVELERAGELELKGKAEPVAAWRVVGLYPERSRERALAGLHAPLIGRAAELARLLEPVGKGVLMIVVVAPPGVGKTRLLNEQALAAAHEDTVVFKARLRPDLLSPFEPVGQLVRSVGEPDDVLGRLPSGRAEVVRDTLAAVVAPVEASGFTDERDVLFRTWLEGLDALSGGRAALWQVEDLHWASADLLAFLEFAAESPTAAGRLIVGTTRPALLESAAAWCERAEVLHLAPLPRAQTEALVLGLVGEALPGELVERIAERSGGNALFVEELLRSWVSTSVLTNVENVWTLAMDPQDVALPPTVQAIYAGQLDDLPGPARTAARRASVAGRRFSLRALQPLNVPDAEDAVGTLARRALVGAAPVDPILGDTYVYRHALLRDVGYASLARGERAKLHVALADWLSELPEEARPTFAELIARHYAAALENAPELAQSIDGKTRTEVRGAAAEWFERAAEVASRFAAWESARVLAARSVELTADPFLRARRLELLAQPTANTAGLSDAEEILREALELYRTARTDEQDGGRAGLSSSGAEIGKLLYAQARFAESHALAESLLHELGPPDDAATGRLLLMRSAATNGAWGDWERAEADAARALELARAAGDSSLEFSALEAVASVLMEAEGPRGLEAWAELEELARRLGRWDTVSVAVRIRAFDHLDQDQDVALGLLDTAMEMSEAHGRVEQIGWCEYARAEAYFGAGRWDDAIDAGMRALEIAEGQRFDRVGVRTWFVLLPIARARGRHDLIRRASRFFEERLKRLPDSHYARVVGPAAHLHFAACGCEPDFVPELEPTLASFDLEHNGPSWLAAVETVVDKWLEAGETGGVAAALDRMRASNERLRVTPVPVGVEALLRGRLHAAEGEGESAAAEAARAVELLGARSPWWRAKAIRLLQRTARSNGELLAEAEEIEAGLGLRAVRREP